MDKEQRAVDQRQDGRGADERPHPLGKVFTADRCRKRSTDRRAEARPSRSRESESPETRRYAHLYYRRSARPLSESLGMPGRFPGLRL